MCENLKNIVENIQELCKLRGVKISNLEKELSFGRGSIYKWDNNSPSIDKVKKVADYFHLTLDEVLPMSDDSELYASEDDGQDQEFINMLYSRYTHFDFLVMLRNLIMTKVSYLHGNKKFKFLPQYQKRFELELKKIGEKYNVDFGDTPDSVEEACKKTKNKDLTKDVLDRLKNVQIEVDSNIRFGKTPPPIPVDDIQTTAAHYYKGAVWTEGELEEDVRALARDIQNLDSGDKNLLTAMIKTMRERGKEVKDEK